MPFIVKDLVGGLGNQIFTIVTAYAFSKKYNTTYTIDMNNESITNLYNKLPIPVYLQSVLSMFYTSEFHKPIETLNNEMNTILSTKTLDIPQFCEYTLPDSINIDTTLITISGLPMRYSLFSDCIDDIQKLFYMQKPNYAPKTIQDKKFRKIGVMFRTFSEEKMDKWMVTDIYYMKAIDHLLSIYDTSKYSIEFHIFTDKEGVLDTIINPILDSLDVTIPCKEYVGKRDNKTDVEHFFQMFDMDDYILCNSTYHYWPALLSTYSEDKIVTFPSHTKDGEPINWFTHIIDPSWVKIE